MRRVSDNTRCSTSSDKPPSLSLSHFPHLLTQRIGVMPSWTSCAPLPSTASMITSSNPVTGFLEKTTPLYRGSTIAWTRTPISMLRWSCRVC